MVVRDGSGGLGEALALVYGSTVLEQRCLFHKLRNVADKACTELKGEEKREERKQEQRRHGPKDPGGNDIAAGDRKRRKQGH